MIELCTHGFFLLKFSAVPNESKGRLVSLPKLEEEGGPHAQHHGKDRCEDVVNASKGKGAIGIVVFAEGVGRNLQAEDDDGRHRNEAEPACVMVNESIVKSHLHTFVAFSLYGRHACAP